MDLTTLAMVRKFMNEKPAGNAIPQPTGTIEITENGTGIDIAQYAFADVNVSTDTGIGELQPIPYITHTQPAVGESSSLDDLPLDTLAIGDAVNDWSSWQPLFVSIQRFKFDAIPDKVICMTATLNSDSNGWNGNSLQAYVCAIDDNYEYVSVEPWDGLVYDYSGDIFTITDAPQWSFQFNMPDLGGYDFENQKALDKILVFYITQVTPDPTE